MEIQFLRKFENQKVKLILKNNFIYSYIIFKIRDDGLVEFEDRKGDIITLEPEFISLITKVNGEENER